ncbi:thermonuclease family protein [Campylobacter jejuni subsp. doylei 269.97]|uniref:Thermonuclease family protein n=3 Tax=Campylobacter jejuni TaxID=197 RepID=A0AAD2LP48_CAMJU|nr:thermonuclease family protein [Campylobacter jejuni subsp. doylei 269.97]AVL47110.1 thermonuclease family protein [Campylobacter jejuni subsp. doylei]EAL7595607.1 thermonuclease family protein [Campylobacter jejuni]EEP3708634.1 thermonuclease family protein [Campylobacter jejuni]
MNRHYFNLLKRILKAKKLSLSLVIAIIVLAVFSFNQVSSFNQSFTTFLAQKNLEKELTGKVSKVIGGDTIELLAKISKTNPYNHIAKLKIRLYGIDAPELKQAYGKEAKEYLSALVLKQEVGLIIENKDKYDRIVGTLFLKGQDINKEMVKNGYAHAYESFSKKYLAEQADAKMFKLGLWQDERVMSPSEFRKQQRKNS